MSQIGYRHAASGVHRFTGTATLIATMIIVPNAMRASLRISRLAGSPANAQNS
jgi:hypothetical protein